MSDPIDDAAFAQTLEMVGGDLGFLAELVDDVPDRRRGPRRRHADGAGGRRRSEDLRRAAHTLKGSSASLGANDLADGVPRGRGRSPRRSTRRPRSEGRRDRRGVRGGRRRARRHASGAAG